MNFCRIKDDFVDPDKDIDLHYYSSSNYEVHTHDYWEIFIITDGMVFHKINGQEMSLKRGDCFLIRPRDIHSFYSKKETFTRHLNIMIQPEFLKHLLDLIDSALYDKLQNYSPYINFSLSEQEYNRCQKLIDKFYFSNNNQIQELAVKFFIIDIISLFYDHVFESKNTAHKEPEWFITIKNMANSPEYIDKSVKKLCQDIPYSHVHLNRLFKEYKGITIAQFFKNIKLDYACNLLIHTNYTIIYIAGLIGYFSISHFNRIFKEKYGLTPSEFRKNKLKYLN